MKIEHILDFKPQAVVVDAGEFPASPIPLAFLSSCTKIVCCDGAANRHIAAGRPLWRIVGDCDSLSPEILRDYAPIIRRNPDQETNDQTKAVQYLKRHGITQIAILAATGRREDHTLGNISLLIDYMRQGIHARIYTDYGVFIPADGCAEFQCPPGTQISIFSFGAKNLKATGLKYPIYDFDTWWQGTLNESSAPDVAIQAQGPYLLFINYPDSSAQ